MKKRYLNYLEEKKKRKKEIKTYILGSFFCILFVLGIYIGYNSRNNTIFKLEKQITKTTKHKDSLLSIVDSMTSDLLEYCKIINDGSYYKYKIFSESGILVPDYVDSSDLILMYEKSREYDIPIKYYFRLINKESRFKHTVKSPVGASGYMQIMPATFNSLLKDYQKIEPEIINLDKNKQNIILGSYYLHLLNKKYKKWNLTLAAYNAGPGNVNKYNGVPPFKETQNYIKYIMQND